MTERSFKADPSSVREARAFARSCLEGHAMVEPAVLVVSELATNAVCHARSAFDLTIKLGPPLRIEVRDNERASPVRKDSSVDSSGGRGLLIVEELSSAWGSRVTRAGGKTVWVEF